MGDNDQQTWNNQNPNQQTEGDGSNQDGDASKDGNQGGDNNGGEAQPTGDNEERNSDR